MMNNWYYQNNWNGMMDWNNHPWFGFGFGFIALWSLFWSGLSLWKSARNGEKYWFLALLLIHTAGILDILYLFVFAKNKLVFVTESQDTKPTSSKRKSGKK